jgi:hypothetical protein
MTKPQHSEIGEGSRGAIYIAQIKAGTHVEYANEPYIPGVTRSVNGSRQTYDQLERTLDRARAGELGTIAEGCWIVDGRGVDDGDAYHTAVMGPMLDQEAGDIDRSWTGEHYQFPRDPISDVFVQTVGVNYLGAGPLVAQMVADVEPGPLDKVPPRTLAACWAKVGAKVGRWRNGAVDWVSPFADPNQLTTGV